VAALCRLLSLSVTRLSVATSPLGYTRFMENAGGGENTSLLYVRIRRRFLLPQIGMARLSVAQAGRKSGVSRLLP